MKKVAFVTYNSVGHGLASGWHGSNSRRALVLQNSKGDCWAVSPAQVRLADLGASLVVAEVDQLWGELQRVVNDIDHVVVYVGSNGSEHAITLAAQLPSSKVTFVGCDCGLPEKEALIQASGLADAKLMLCECGGHWTMEALFQRFMETGEIHPVVA